MKWPKQAHVVHTCSHSNTEQHAFAFIAIAIVTVALCSGAAAIVAVVDSRLRWSDHKVHSHRTAGQQAHKRATNRAAVTAAGVTGAARAAGTNWCGGLSSGAACHRRWHSNLSLPESSQSRRAVVLFVRPLVCTSALALAWR